MDTTSATSTPLSIKNILESVADARENLIKRLQGIEDNLNKKYDKKIDALQSDYTSKTTAEEEKYQKDKQKLIEEHPDDKSRLEELEKKHTETLNSLQEKLNKAVHNVKSEAIEEIIGVISGIDNRLSKDDLTFSDLDYVLNQIKAELTINSAIKFLNEWHGNIQTLSKQLGGDTGFAAKKYSELKTLLAKSEESAKKTAEGVSKVGESMADANAQFEETFNNIVRDFADKISEEEKTDKDLLKAIAIAHGGAEKSLEDLKKRYGSLDAAKNKNVEGTLKKSIVEMLRTRHKDLEKNEEALGKIADAYISHAQGRKKLAEEAGKVESNREKLHKGINKFISKDTAGGRLLKMFIAGAKAKKEGKYFRSGMWGSIKQDIRKDYDSFFYKDAESLGGIGRMVIGSFLESRLSVNKKARAAEKALRDHDEQSEQKIRQLVEAAKKPSIGAGKKQNAADVTTAKISGYASGKRNIEDGVHVVGEKGAELLVKRGNSISVLQIKSDVSAPASVGVSPIGAGQQMESSAEFERKQQETNDRHAIAENLKSIIEILNRSYELKKKEVNSNTANGGGLLSGLTTFLSGLIGGKLVGFLKRGFSKLGSLIMKPLAKIGTLISSSFRTLMNGVRSIFGMPKIPDVKVPALGEVPIKTAEGAAKKGRFSGIKNAFKNFKPKNAFKIGLKGLGKGLLAGVAIELMREGVARGSASVLGLTPEEYEKSRARVEDMEYGHGRTDDMLAEKSDAQAEDEQYEAYKRTSEMWYRKRCKELGIHHKTNQDSWFTSSKDYRELTYDEIMALNPREREYFDAWLHSKEGESKLAKLQREHPEVFGTLRKTKSSSGGLAAPAIARAAAMKARAKNPSAPTKEAKETAKKMQETNLLPAGLGIAAALGAEVGSSKGSGASGETVIPAAGLGLGLGAEINPEVAKEDTHHKTSNNGLFANIKENLKGNRKLTDTIQDILLRIEISTKSMQKNIDSICKMVRLIKVDGITLGEMLDHPMTAKSGGAGQQGTQTPGAQAGSGGGGGGPSIPGVSNPVGGSGGGASGMPTGGGVGDIVKVEESGKEGSMKIGYDDKGGTSYGTYQFATSAKSDSMSDFLRWAEKNGGEFGQNLARDMRAAGPLNTGGTTGAGVDVWRKYVSSNPELFKRLEKGFMAQRTVDALNSKNMDPNLAKLIQSDRGLQEAWWSTVVQHGPGGARTVFKQAAAHCGGNLNPQNLISAVYDVRSGVFRNGGHKANIKKSVLNRFEREKQTVLGLSGKPIANMLAIDGPSASPSTPPPSPIPQAQFVPAANGDPYKQTLVPQMNPQQTAQPQSGSRISNLLNIAARNARNAHGYSQGQKERMSTHFDCSSFVGRSLREAGFNIPANLTTPQMNPRNKNNVMSNEFTWVPGLQGMQPGDVMWRSGHTELYIGNGKTIGALNGRVSRDKQVGVHPLDWGEFVGYWHPKPKAGESENPQQTMQPAQGQNPLAAQMNPSPAPGSGGDMRQIPAQQQAPIIPHMTEGPIQGLSGLYANLTRDAMARHVGYRMNSKNSRSGLIDCSGWVTEMNKTALGGLSGQARTNMEAIVRGGQQGGAAGLIQAGESLGFGIDGGQLDPRLGRVKENMMIGLSIGGHAKGRYKNIGHVVQTYRDPTTGELMVSESTSRSRIGGRSGVITTKYSDWYEKYKSAGLHAVDLNAVTGGAFAGGNIRDAMGGVQMPDMGQAAGPSAGPQIQGSQQAQAQQAAQAYYESGGGGGNVYAPTTNVMGGGGNADKGGATFLTTKDPMSWIILQGNTVH